MGVKRRRQRRGENAVDLEVLRFFFTQFYTADTDDTPDKENLTIHLSQHRPNLKYNLRVIKNLFLYIKHR